MALPAGFPLRLEGPLVWSGRTDKLEYISQLDPEDITDIEKAVSHFKALKLPRGSITKSTFPLPPTLSEKLKQISHIVHNEHGFQILRGLEPSNYSREDNIIAYVGITTHVAEKRAYMRQAYNRVQRSPEERVPPNLLGGPMSFHTDVDQGDMFSLFVPNTSVIGGSQYIVSFWHVYNVLAKESPQVLNLLAEDWRFEMPASAGNIRNVDRPIIYYIDGKLEITFGRAFLTRSRSSQNSDLPVERLEAVDILLKRCKEHAVKHCPSRGDILFGNNLGLLHARDDYVDEASVGKVRHLIGMLLKDPGMAWPQPAELRVDASFSGPRDDFDSILRSWEQDIPTTYVSSP